MTLPSETVRVQYSGDDSTIVFAVTFVFWDLDDLQVILTDAAGVETTWTRGTQYTVTGGSGSTGTVTVETTPTDFTPATGETLTIKSNLDDTQDTDLPVGGSFPSDSVEQQLDKIVRMIQQKAEDLGRAIKFAVSSTFTDITFPDPEAGKVIRWNSTADALENSTATDGSALTLPLSVADGGTGVDTVGEIQTLLLVSPGPIGGTTPAAGSFTTLTLTGDYTNTAQPAFLAYNSVTDTGAIGTAGTGFVTVDFDTEVYDQGTDFASDTYTASVTGRHLLTTMVKLSAITSAADSASIRIVTSNRTYSVTFANVNDMDSSMVLTITVIADMDAADTAIVQVEVQGEATDVVAIEGGSVLLTYFSGILVA